MAPGRVEGALPPVSSTDEDESTQEESEESGDAGEAEDSEVSSHETNAALGPPHEPLAKKSTSKKRGSASVTQAPVTSSDSDSSSDSHSDSSQERVPRHSGAPNPTVKPLASKPLVIKSKVPEKTPMEKKPRSKAAVADSPLKPAAAAKRPLQETSDGKESKRPKKKVSDLASDDADENLVEKSKDPKKSNTRVWSDDDAILMLKVMLEYTNKKGEDSFADMNALYDFILKHLHVAVSKNQVVDKVRRLKSKYRNNLSKAKQGEDWSLSKPHEQEAFELSKKIWGGGDEIVPAPVHVPAPARAEHNGLLNGKIKNNSNGAQLNGPTGLVEYSENLDHAPFVCELVRLNSDVGAPRLSEDTIKKGLAFLGGAEKAELEERWKKMLVAKMEAEVLQLDFMKKGTELILQGIKSPKN